METEEHGLAVSTEQHKEIIDGFMNPADHPPLYDSYLDAVAVYCVDEETGQDYLTNNERKELAAWAMGQDMLLDSAERSLNGLLEQEGS